MSRLKSVIGFLSGALAWFVVVGLALGPEPVTRGVDEALSASWNVLGERLADRELHSIAWQLDRQRQFVARVVDQRDDLGARLEALEAVRDQLAARSAGGGPDQRTGSEHELARLDGAIALLSSVIARADRSIERARRDLSEREGELIELRAAADAHRMIRALAEPIDDPSPWSVRVARARDFLRTTPWGGEGQGPISIGPDAVK